MPKPTVPQVFSDPEFKALPPAEQMKVVGHLDPDFAGLPAAEQAKALVGLHARFSKSGLSGSLLNPELDMNPTAMANAALSRQAQWQKGNMAVNPTLPPKGNPKQEWGGTKVTGGAAALVDAAQIPGQVFAPSASYVPITEEQKQFYRARGAKENEIPAMVPRTPSLTGALEDVAGIYHGAKQLVADPIKRWQEGDKSGAISEGAVNVPLLIEMLRGGYKAGKGVVSEVTRGPQRNVRPETVNMSDKAIGGTERIFRAAAPVGSDPMFRSSLYDASGDLAEIGRNIDLSKGKGGILPGNPDMRVELARDAINKHLKTMYEAERQPQIARHADTHVAPQFGTDAVDGLKYLTRAAGKSGGRAVATTALSNTSMPLGQLDELGRIVNQELAPLRGMTPQELAASGVTNRRLASLQALDREIKSAINRGLVASGEEGIGLYEKRYAALSAVRDQIQTRINMTELQRHNPLNGIFNMLKKPSLAGASQAATANVNIGRQLQKGFQMLADSELQPTRYYARPDVRGYLTAGSTPLGSSAEPIGQLSQPQTSAATSRAQRFNLLLPERASISRPIQLPSEMEPLGQPSQGAPTLDYYPSLQQPSQFVRPGEIRPSPFEGNLFRDLFSNPQGPLFDLLIRRTKKK